MKKYTYYLVNSNNFLRKVKSGDIIKGYLVYSAPFHPTDDSKVYCLGGYAIGWKQTQMAMVNRDIIKISRKEAIKRLLLEVR